MDGQADAKRRAEHELKVAQQRAAAAEKRAKKEMEKHEREKQEDEQRCSSRTEYNARGRDMTTENGGVAYRHGVFFSAVCCRQWW